MLYFSDIFSFQIRIVAEHGKQDRNGWAALDKVSLVRTKCEFEPKDAFPPTTPSPPSTTVPPHDTELCPFQENLCNYTVEGVDEFKFTRTRGGDVGEIGTDRHGNEDGYFLYAQKTFAANPEAVWTYVLTDEFNGDHHPIECFHFWFYIDGFFVRILYFV